MRRAVTYMLCLWTVKYLVRQSVVGLVNQELFVVQVRGGDAVLQDAGQAILQAAEADQGIREFCQHRLAALRRRDGDSEWGS